MKTAQLPSPCCTSKLMPRRATGSRLEKQEREERLAAIIGERAQTGEGRDVAARVLFCARSRPWLE